MIRRPRDPVSRAVLGEWRWLLAFVLALGALLLHQGWLARVNNTFYDAALALYARPLTDNIVVIAVDEPSLAQVGRWPWRREVHARLLDRLTEAGAATVGLDLILSEPDTLHPEDDAALVQALRRNAHVVLPVFTEWRHGHLKETRPLPALADAAAFLGHIQSDPDADGVMRRVFMRCGMGYPNYPQFGVALLQSAGIRPPQPNAPTRLPATDDTDWFCAEPYWIPYAGKPGTVRQFSAAALLNGEVPAAELQGKIVLVGATASGLGDAMPTPVSGDSYAMPGVEIHAQLMDALQRGLLIVPAAPWLKVIYTLLPVALLLAAFLFLLPRMALLANTAAILGVLSFSAFSLRWPGFWFPPAEALLLLALAYPLWSWRKLEAGMRFLSEEVAALDQETSRFASLLPVAPPPPVSGIVDPVSGRIAQVRRASREARALRALVQQAITSQPVGVLLLDSTLTVRLSNPVMLSFLGKHDPAELYGLPAATVLAGWRCPDEAGWQNFLRALTRQGSAQREVTSGDGRIFQLGLTTVENLGWIVTLDDVTELKAREQERRRLLNFLSHDMRAPQASILALLDQHPELDEKTAGEIRAYAGRTLHLVSQFIYLARAENLQQEDFVDFDLTQCLHDAIDELWPQAQVRQVQLVRPDEAPYLTVHGDPTLMRRALINLIDNAIKHTPAGKRVVCQLELEEGRAHLSVRDEGEGIRPQDQARLFQTFSRVGDTTKREGSGLGLALVKLVAERHGGRATVQSILGHGAVFSLVLPLAHDD